MIRRDSFGLGVLIFASACVLRAQDFTGRVVEDSSGDPIATAELKIHKTGMRELVADLDTDRTGRFTGSDLPAGDYTIDVLKPNFITTTFPVHLPASPMQVRLVHYGVMDGRVTNIQGLPMAAIVRKPGGQTIGATRVTVLAKQPDSDDYRSLHDAQLDETGHFRVYDLPPGQYKIGVWYYGVNEGSGMQLFPDNANPRVFTVAGGEVYKDLNFLIAPNPEYRVSGRVVAPAPKMNFALALGLADQPTLPLAVALTADDGTFHFDKVPPGTYDLFVSGPTGGYTQFDSVLSRNADAVFGRMQVQVAGADITDLTVPVSAAKSVKVTMRAHGGGAFPAACAQSGSVGFAPLDPWSVLFQVNSPISAGKEQTVSNLAPGRFRVTASGLGDGCYQVNDIVVDLGKETDTVAVEVAAAGSILGALPQGGVRAAEYAVLLIDSASTGSSQLAFPDAAGHFAFASLKPGRYRIAVKAATEASKARWLTNLAQMKEIDVAGGVVTNVSLEFPVGGVQ